LNHLRKIAQAHFSLPERCVLLAGGHLQQTGASMAKRREFDVTMLQTVRLDELRKRLAESGYFIFSVSRRFRRQRHDFLAVNKDNRNEFFIVRPEQKGGVSITPYGPVQQPRKVADILEDMRSAALYVHWLPQFLPNRTNLRLEHFFTEQGERKYRRLMQKQTPAG